ncbi:CoA-binding protein [Actinomadura madurae]|uniref:CoA-binding protein n=1 Tax=Actinomadura madurae TaxID=1993 RepID=UPI0020D2315C|nr:CoA-binding protein [Actinomadura madurae]MCQ0014438.1 CoA-binding protein [Actinomadura madurae]
MDLAVITVPADSVVHAAEACGRSGTPGLVVISSGLTADQGRGLLAACREYGMRLVGPNCLGIANTGIWLDATFAARPPRPRWRGRGGAVGWSGHRPSGAAVAARCRHLVVRLGR